MIPSTREMQFDAALYALKRITRTVDGLSHKREDEPTCVCPQCVAKDALNQINSLEQREFIKAGG